jgi:hypothetical protein
MGIYWSYQIKENDMEAANFRAEWLSLLLYIREVPGSNLGAETSYPD